MSSYTDIKNYINYLKTEHNLSVTVYFIKTGVALYQELLPYNIHDNSYCIYLKNCDEAAHNCRMRYINLTTKLKEGTIEDVCHAGVREYVYPISDGEEIIGSVSVSGYRCENCSKYIKDISSDYNLPQKELESAYKSLKKAMPSKEWADTLIMPLCDMLELFFIKNKKNDNAKEDLCDRFVRYLQLFHNHNITSEEMCRHFSISRSYLSRKFNAYTGKSIKEYITMLRIEDAKELLTSSDLSITEVAFCVGFRDANYFTQVFKREVGQSPMRYKKGM